jgi:hypothetical protein
VVDQVDEAVPWRARTVTTFHASTWSSFQIPGSAPVVPVNWSPWRSGGRAGAVGVVRLAMAAVARVVVVGGCGSGEPSRSGSLQGGQPRAHR